METLKAFILDDEIRSITSLRWELKNFEHVIQIVGESNQPKEAIDLIKAAKPDALFLDIEMPELNGFEVLNSFTEIDFAVIFTTAYDEFAVKAFEISAIDYLLKPVGKDELQRAIEKLQSQFQSRFFEKRLKVLFETYYQENVPHRKVVIPTMDGLEFVELSSIIRCESDGSYTSIFIQNRGRLLIAKSIKEVERILDNNSFFRIHNSHIVNLNYIQKYRKGKSGSIELTDGTIIPVSRNKKTDFLGKI